MCYSRRNCSVNLPLLFVTVKLILLRFIFLRYCYMYRDSLYDQWRSTGVFYNNSVLMFNEILQCIFVLQARVGTNLDY